MANDRPTRCPHVTACPLFPQFAMKSSLRVWSTYYCEGQYETCARFKLSLGGRPCPDLLLPNGRTLGAAGGDR